MASKAWPKSAADVGPWSQDGELMSLSEAPSRVTIATNNQLMPKPGALPVADRCKAVVSFADESALPHPGTPDFESSAVAESSTDLAPASLAKSSHGRMLDRASVFSFTAERGLAMAD